MSFAATVVLLSTLSGAPRYALSVGSNAGGPGRDTLWFAEQDAQRFANALVELGGFERADVTVLGAPSGSELKRAVKELSDLGRDALARGEVPLLVFYYSGHADRLGLELGADRLTYKELSLALATVTEGVRLMILDACHSGALTQVKGAKPAPLDFEVLRDPRADGVAIITSSSASEQAQESAQLHGSFFTHHFVLGLRGAADADADQRVTLSEAYRYAYHRTLSSTAESGAAPQHPTYSLKLAGKGEVVLADLRQVRSALEFPKGLGRRYLISAEHTQEVVAEVSTMATPLRVALPQGRYRVDRLLPKPRLSGVLELPAEGVMAVDDARLTRVPLLVARAKGGEVRRTHLGVEGWLGSPVMQNFGPGFGVGLSLRQDLEAPVTLALRASYSRKDVKDADLGYQYQAITGLLGIGWRTDFSWLSLLLGLEAGVGVAFQEFKELQESQGMLGSQPREALLVLGGPFVGAAVPVLEFLSVRMTAAGHAQSFRLNGEQVVRPSAQLTVTVEVDL